MDKQRRGQKGVGLLVVSFLIGAGLWAGNQEPLYSAEPVSAKATAQSSKSCKESPRWVDMLDDPDTTNYFELQKCFAEYWSNHEIPILEGPEEKEPFEEPFFERDKEREKNRSKLPLTKEEAEIMPGAIKRYNDFVNTHYIFVQPDGRILSKKEQMDIWKSQQRSENKNKAKLRP